MSSLVDRLLPVALVILSAVLHECAHGYAAYLLGDPTAKEQGRLTLNPLAHLDPFGSVLLPLLMALSGVGVVFSFAKPVPVNLARLRNPQRDGVLVSLAGPAANLVQALVGAGLFHACALLINAGMYDLYVILGRLLVTFVYVNLVLMFFNLLPLPPLDGSKVVAPLLPEGARRALWRFEPYAVGTLLLVLFLVPRLIGFDPLSAYLDATAGRLFSVLVGF